MPKDALLMVRKHGNYLKVAKRRPGRAYFWTKLKRADGCTPLDRVMFNVCSLLQGLVHSGWNVVMPVQMWGRCWWNVSQLHVYFCRLKRCFSCLNSRRRLLSMITKHVAFMEFYCLQKFSITAVNADRLNTSLTSLPFIIFPLATPFG